MVFFFFLGVERKMLSKFDAGKKIGGDSSNRKLNEIEAIGKALYLDKNPSRSSIPKVNIWSKLIGKAHLSDPN